jgi:molybdopterin/thiamine biosynthesis adenylyltransferase
MSRYDRQMRVEGWDQKKLTSSKVSLVGAGALGSMIGIQLACLGVGRIDVYDNDVIEETNLNRQFIYFDCVGKEKAIALAEKLARLNPLVKVEGYVERINDVSVSLLGKTDVIVDSTDNFQARSILNKYAVEEKIPLISGATSASSGQVIAYLPGKTSCLECQIGINKLAKEEVDRASCLADPDPSVITTNWIIAGIMAEETRKILAPTNESDKSLEQMLKYDLLQPLRFALVKCGKKCACREE